MTDLHREAKRYILKEFKNFTEETTERYQDLLRTLSNKFIVDQKSVEKVIEDGEVSEGENQ